MKHIQFGNTLWRDALLQAYTFRYAETPEFTQTADHIATKENPAHAEGFDNISLLDPEIRAAGVKATLDCAFDGLGCPEIILVKKPEACPDGHLRYGECFEIVLWKNGINIWRHFMDENRNCSWELRMSLNLPVKEGVRHQLSAEVQEGYLLFGVDGVTVRLRCEDLFPEFYIGLTACEGIVRLYDMTIA